MKYAVIVWVSEDEILNGKGTICGWYEMLGTALNTAVNLRQNGSFAYANVVKLV